jgi:hypothetical protein
LAGTGARLTSEGYPRPFGNLTLVESSLLKVERLAEFGCVIPLSDGLPVLLKLAASELANVFEILSCESRFRGLPPFAPVRLRPSFGIYPLLSKSFPCKVHGAAFDELAKNLACLVQAFACLSVVIHGLRRQAERSRYRQAPQFIGV